MVGIALGLADGQIEQADRMLTPGVHRRNVGDPLVRCLEHARSACGWLRSAAEAMQTREGSVV